MQLIFSPVDLYDFEGLLLAVRIYNCFARRVFHRKQLSSPVLALSVLNFLRLVRNERRTDYVFIQFALWRILLRFFAKRARRPLGSILVLVRKS